MDTNTLNKDNITLLCKVVDNYGDIGFVYRLSRSISKLAPNKTLNLVVSNLSSFAAMAPEVNPNKKIQHCFGWNILDWNSNEECKKYFTENPPDVILECFQCGRPDWLEDIIFEKDNKKIYQIINVEYLTAEEWADDFHLLKSATRSQYVRKINFMPGFTNKTGGLVLDNEFISYLNDKTSASKALYPYLSKADIEALKNENTFCITLFSYPREYNHILEALKEYESKIKEENPSFNIHIFCANGKCYQNLKKTQFFNSIKTSELPYLPQSSWDALLTLCDFNFIRGEDSFSRACLSGKPFIWHAYIQDEEFQLIKAHAILERIKPFLENDIYNTLYEYTLLYNHEKNVILGEEALNLTKNLDFETDQENREKNLLFKLLNSYLQLKKGFIDFSNKLISNGDLTKNLLIYIDNL